MQGLEAPPCKLPLDKNDKKTLVLGITVPGAPYPEDVERRRRTRYAVLAGLKQSGFAPEDRRHIHYFVWSQSPSPASFLSETPPELPLLACGTPASAHFACVSTCIGSRRRAAVWLIAGFQLAIGSIPAGCCIGGTRHRSIRTVRESSRTRLKPSDNDSPDSVLVLWLKEDVLMHQPLTALNSLAGLLNRDQNLTVKFIGPSSSDMLHEMVNEAWTQNGFTCSDTKSPWRNLEDVKFYAYLASAPDDYLFGKLHNPCDSLQDYFEKLGIHLQRTIATEDTLANGIRDELLLRTLIQP